MFAAVFVLFSLCQATITSFEDAGKKKLSIPSIEELTMMKKIRATTPPTSRSASPSPTLSFYTTSPSSTAPLCKDSALLSGPFSVPVSHVASPPLSPKLRALSDPKDFKYVSPIGYSQVTSSLQSLSFRKVSVADTSAPSQKEFEKIVEEVRSKALIQSLQKSKSEEMEKTLEELVLTEQGKKAFLEFLSQRNLEIVLFQQIALFLKTKEECFECPEKVLKKLSRCFSPIRHPEILIFLGINLPKSASVIAREAMRRINKAPMDQQIDLIFRHGNKLGELGSLIARQMFLRICANWPSQFQPLVFNQHLDVLTLAGGIDLLSEANLRRLMSQFDRKRLKESFPLITTANHKRIVDEYLSKPSV